MTDGTTCILYRTTGSSSDIKEQQAAEQAGFKVIYNRVLVPPNSLVVPRYSARPFYRNLEEDITLLKSKLVNTTTQFGYVEDLQNWVSDLGTLTPATWSRLEDLPEEGPFLLKGAINSRKDRWRTHMFAEDKRAAMEVYNRLQQDSLISAQRIYIRKYQPLKSYTIDLAGVPIANEYRFFICYGQVIAGGYYWSNFSEELETPPDPTKVPSEFLAQVITKIGSSNYFYSVDVAETVEGHWIVIELNAGEMSGLSDIDPIIFYSNLKKTLDHHLS